MKHRGSIIASEIDREYKRRLQWKERIERLEQINKEKEQKGNNNANSQ